MRCFVVNEFKLIEWEKGSENLSVHVDREKKWTLETFLSLITNFDVFFVLLNCSRRVSTNRENS